jgi:hypothetical protein
MEDIALETDELRSNVAKLVGLESNSRSIDYLDSSIKGTYSKKCFRTCSHVTRC